MYRVPIFSMTLRRRERRVGAMVKVMRVIRIRGWITKAMKRLRGISSGLRIGCHKIC
jgi:acetolactate synthase regulatory subunit